MTITMNLGETGHKFQYVPTLRTKAGEVTALANLLPAVKLRTVPIFQITPSVGANFIANLAAAWDRRPFAIDGLTQTTVSQSAAAFNQLIGAAIAATLCVAPLLEVGCDPIYESAVLQVKEQHGLELVLRVKLEDLPSAHAYLAQKSLNPAETDLIIDCGHIAEMPAAVLAAVVVTALQTPAVHGWKSVTLSSSSAPKDASLLSLGPNLVPRSDFLLWSTVYPTIRPIPLHFGDFGITHRDLSEPPGFAMANATVTPRYTLAKHWLILRGRSTKGANGQPMGVQYHGHAQTLVANQSFGGVNCWADAQIAQIAGRAGIGPSGNRETWVGYGLNRHISVVDAQLL